MVRNSDAARAETDSAEKYATGRLPTASPRTATTSAGGASRSFGDRGATNRPYFVGRSHVFHLSAVRVGAGLVLILTKKSHSGNFGYLSGTVS